MKSEIKLGFQDYTALVFIPDPASTDGSGKTGLVAANLTVSYTRVETDNDVVVTDVTSSLSNLAALTTAHTDWGLLEVSNTLAPGLYRLDIADAVFAAGAWTAVVYVMITTSAAAASPMEFVLVAFDPLDTVRLGLTALPNAAAEAAGGLFTRGTGTGQINQAANGMMDSNIVRLNNVAQSLLDLKDFADDGYDPTSDKVAGVVLVDTVTTYTGNTPQTGDSFARLGAPAGSSVSADILVVDNLVDDLESRVGTPSNLGSGATVAANLADIEAQTDDIGAAGAGLTAIPWNASWDVEVQSEVDDALVAQNLDHLVKIAVDTDFPTTVHLNSVIGHLADNGTSATFDRTTDSLEALESKIDAVDNFIDTEIGAIITTLGTPAGTSISADLLVIDNFIDDLETRLTAARAGYLDNLSAGAVALQASVDDLEGRLTAVRAGYLDNLSAGAVGLESTLAIIAAYIDTEIAAILAAVDTEIAAIKAKTDSLTFTVAGKVDANALLIEGLDATDQINAEVVDAVSTDVIADSVAADGSRPTMRQALLMILRFLTEKSVSGTTVTVKKEDGSTSSMTFTLDSATTPTSITRAS